MERSEIPSSTLAPTRTPSLMSEGRRRRLDVACLSAGHRRRESGVEVKEERVAMHGVVRRYEMGSGSRGSRVAEVLGTRIEEDLGPAVSEVPGFVAFYSLDTGDGKIALISIFEHEEGAEEFNRLAKDFAKDRLAGLLQAGPQVTAGRVLVHKP
jgi:hypothetical protein